VFVGIRHFSSVIAAAAGKSVCHPHANCHRVRRPAIASPANQLRSTMATNAPTRPSKSRSTNYFSPRARAFFSQHAPDQFVIQQQFVLTRPNTTQSQRGRNESNWVEDVFSTPSRSGFFPRTSRPRFENISQIGLPKLRAVGIQPDRQCKFRRPVVASRICKTIPRPTNRRATAEAARPVAHAGKHFLFEPVVRRAGKFVQRLFAERLRLG